MKTIETYFGLEFGDEFPLDQKTRRQLAKLLFANPNTSPEEAIRIILIIPDKLSHCSGSN